MYEQAIAKHDSDKGQIDSGEFSRVRIGKTDTVGLHGVPPTKRRVPATAHTKEKKTVGLFTKADTK